MEREKVLKMLREKIREHTGDVVAVIKTANESVTSSRDPSLGAIDHHDAALKISLVSLERETLRGMEEAYDRIERGGEIGTCMECKQDIEKKRLKVFPYADRCTGCQDAVEQRKKHGEPLLESSYAKEEEKPPKVAKAERKRSKAEMEGFTTKEVNPRLRPDLVEMD